MAENFNINEEEINLGEVRMSVSAICNNGQGEKYAYVYFEDDNRSAEGKIPDCRIDKNNGFAEIEVQQLQKYMKEHLAELKKMAAGINIFDAFTK